jgi:hypothetical protein
METPDCLYVNLPNFQERVEENWLANISPQFFDDLSNEETTEEEDTELKESREEKDEQKFDELINKAPPRDCIKYKPKRKYIFFIIDCFLYIRNQVSDNDSLWKLRKKFIKIIGWSIPTPASLYKIYRFINTDQVLEVGAGLGAWSHLLQSSGINLISTSAICRKYYYPKDMLNTWTNIEIIDCVSAIKKYNPECLFLSWGNKILLRCMQVFKGSKIIIIGEKFDSTDCLYESAEVGSKNIKFDGVKVYEPPPQGLSSESYYFYRVNRITTDKINKYSVVYPYKLTKRIKLENWSCIGVDDSISFYERL